jgi:hypothetical protein
MLFEFGKYTEITDFAFKENPEYEENKYIRIFICPDVWDYHLVRILKGYGKDYENDEDSYIMERDKIPMEKKGQGLTIRKVRDIVQNDLMENWDYYQSYDLNDLIDRIDGGFGILNLKTVQYE